METLAEIRECIRNRPDLRIVEGEMGVTVKTSKKNGFDISFFDSGNEYTVSFGGWHEHFEHTDMKSALNCVAFGLSDKCRLKVFTRGNSDYKWVLEVLEEGKWVEDSTTSLLFTKFWRKRAVRYLSNGDA